MTLIVGSFEDVAAVRRARFTPGTTLTLVRCELCGYIEGEESAPCCRKCGDDGEPIEFTVAVIEQFGKQLS